MKGELLGFTLGGIHSSDFNLVRTNKGMTTKELTGKSQDITQKIDKSDITIFYKNIFQSKSLTLNTAFVKLTEEQLLDLKKIWNKDQMYPLVLDETPHKQFMVVIDKITHIKHLAFEQNGKRYYNGEITFSFISYFPYAVSRFESEMEGKNTLNMDLLGFWENLNEIPKSKNQIMIEGNEGYLELYNFGDKPALIQFWVDIVLPQVETGEFIENNGIQIPILSPKKFLQFDLQISTQSMSCSRKMTLKGLTPKDNSKDECICIDCFRGTIFGYNNAKTINNHILYNGTMKGDFLLLPPKEVSYITFTLSNAKAYTVEGIEDNSIEIYLDKLNLDYNIQYVYQE